MNVNINFPAEIETALLRQAAAAGQDVATFVKDVIIERLADEHPPAKSSSHAEFMAKLHGVIELHPASNGLVDDSRESIYAGRGE